LPGNAPSRPGAFRIEGAPPGCGPVIAWVLLVAAPNLKRVGTTSGPMTVFADPKQADCRRPRASAEPEDPAAIA
jgi:hypothetical protein